MKFSRTEALLNSFAQTIVNRYRDKISEYASGKLYKTINFEITKGNSNYIVTINLEEYWKNISYGRKPGSRMPPLEAIENWIKIRKIIPRPLILPNKKSIIPTVKQLAFIIARSIAKKGIQQRPLMRETLAETVETFKDKLIITLKEDIISEIQHE